MSIQNLLKDQLNGRILGWQSPQLCKRKTLFKPLPVKAPFIQVLHVNGNHWVTISNVKPNSDKIFDDTVCIYDSNWTEKSSLSLNTKQQICSFFKCKAKKVFFEFVNVDRQTNGSDCGLYALAFAAELAHGSDPSLFVFDSVNLRDHVLQCIKSEYVTLFPKKRKRRLGLGR